MDSSIYTGLLRLMLRNCLLTVFVVASLVQANDVYRLSGFLADKSNTSNAVYRCPEGFHELNSYCWRDGATPELQIQNKFMQQFYDDESEDNFAEVDAYSVGLTVTAGATDRVTGNVPLSNITLSLSHDGQKAQRILLLGQSTLQTLQPNETIQLTTNNLGRAVFAVLVDNELHKPLFRIQPAYMPPDQRVTFPVDTHAMFQIAQLTGADLVVKNAQGAAVLPQGTPLNAAEAAAATIRQLLLPVVHGELDDENASQSVSGLKKRSFQFHFQSKSDGYHEATNRVRSRTSPEEKQQKIYLATHRAPHQFWHLKFNNDGAPSFHALSSEEHRKHMKGLYTQRLYKRSNYFQNLGSRIKEWGGSVGNFSKAVFVDVPKALFNRSAYKLGAKEAATNIQKALNNVTLSGIDLTYDFVDIFPFGDKLNDKLGLSKLVQQIHDADSILVSHSVNGLELTVVQDKGNAVIEYLISSVQQVLAAIKGIFLKIKANLQRLLDLIKTSFDWDGILLNHRVLSSHLMKMVPFIKAVVTSRQSNVSTDARNMISRLSNMTEEATKAFFHGNMTDMAGAIKTANNEIMKNMTYNPEIPLPESGETRPVDMHASFLTDHLGSNFMRLQVEVDEQDKRSLFDLAKETAQRVGDIGNDTASEVTSEIHQLSNQVKGGKLTFSELFWTISRIVQFAAAVAVEKLIEGVLVAFDAYITLLDQIMRSHIKLPFITKFYERTLTRKSGKFTLYDLMALMSAVPNTAMFRMTHKGENMFTPEEAEIIIATENPEMYVDNLVSYAMQLPDRNVTAVRNMYRISMSYILGAGYATGQMMSAIVGQLTGSVLILYVIRIPFELVSNFCNYPWSWYTNTLTSAGMNVRFLSWISQFIAFFTTWAVETKTSNAFNIFSVIALVLGTIPSMVMMVRVWMQDLKILNDKLLPPVDGTTSLDITLKYIARISMNAPRILLFITNLPEPPTQVLRATIVFGATLQNVRLYIDMMQNAIYSV